MNDFESVLEYLIGLVVPAWTAKILREFDGAEFAVLAVTIVNMDGASGPPAQIAARKSELDAVEQTPGEAPGGRWPKRRGYICC